MAEPPEKQTSSKKAARSTRKTPDTSKGQPWTFPKNSLEDSIRIAQAVEEKNAGNPMPAKDLAIAVGFKQPQD
jgi:hypothetical protein